MPTFTIERESRGGDLACRWSKMKKGIQGGLYRGGPGGARGPGACSAKWRCDAHGTPAALDSISRPRLTETGANLNWI
jgi:hypothetical protein